MGRSRSLPRCARLTLTQLCRGLAGYARRAPTAICTYILHSVRVLERIAWDTEVRQRGMERILETALVAVGTSSLPRVLRDTTIQYRCTGVFVVEPRSAEQLPRVLFVRPSVPSPPPSRAHGSIELVGVVDTSLRVRTRSGDGVSIGLLERPSFVRRVARSTVT